jgi:Na+-transporting NADH:ubiquinone oxidoreductase subunit B
MLVGLESGSIGETSTLMVLAGAAILILTGVGAWRIMAGGLIAMATTCWLSRLLPIAAGIPHLNTPTLWHLVMGGFAFGLVFMATDPVSAAISNAGKWIYGALIGFMTAVIRLYNPAFMEGTMLAILFANALAPLIDYGVLQVHMNRRMRRLNGARG